MEIRYDKNAKRPERVQESLDAVAHQRGGKMHVTIVGTTGSPLPVKDCPHCQNPSPMITQSARFVCRKCILLFF